MSQQSWEWVARVYMKWRQCIRCLVIYHGIAITRRWLNLNHQQTIACTQHLTEDSRQNRDLSQMNSERQTRQQKHNTSELKKKYLILYIKTLVTVLWLKTYKCIVFFLFSQLSLSGDQFSEGWLPIEWWVTH